MSTLSSLSTGRVRFIVAGSLVALFLLALPLVKSRASLQPPSILSNHPTGDKGGQLHSDVYNTTLGFERIYVLNLPERTDKKDGITLQAAVSGFKLDFIDGVKVDAIPEKALPIKHSDDSKSSWVAAWRAHMNAITEIVRLNLTSALIVEDDVDWDISLKDILRDVATSTRAISNDRTGSEMNLAALSPGNTPSQISPYGDEWDVIWLGHCGTRISDTDSRVAKYNDHTVLQPQHLHSWDPNEVTPLAIYPNHTRLVGHLEDATCSLAYAVSQAGARKILYDMGVLRLDMAYDLMLRAFCNGSSGRKTHNCLGVLPPVFEHYRRAGSIASDSDLHNVDSGYRDEGFTMNIRYSVALNLDKLLEGSTDYREQYPDT